MNGLHEKMKVASMELITKMISKDSREWPPTCPLFSYQPDRPMEKVEQQIDKNEMPTGN